MRAASIARRQRELIAAAWNDRDRTGLERLAQHGDLHVKVALADPLARPHSRHQFAAADDPVALRGQRQQQLVCAAQTQG
jgi:hypothetical protein